MPQAFESNKPKQVDASVASAWATAALGWHQHAGLIRTWLAEATCRMLDAGGLALGAKVLDVAAGAGDQTRDIAARIGPEGEIWVTDVVPGLLQFAEQTLRDIQGTRLEYRVADAQSLGLAGAGFDAAVCRLGLMFCMNPEKALRQMHDALRPRGRVCLMVFGAPASNPCITITLRVAARHAGVQDVDFSAPGTLLSLGQPNLLAQCMGKAGFVNVATESVSAPFCVPKAKDYVSFVRRAGSPVMAMLQSLSPAQQEAAWQDMEHELNEFSTSSGWVGPNGLLTASGVRG